MYILHKCDIYAQIFDIYSTAVFYLHLFGIHHVRAGGLEVFQDSGEGQQKESPGSRIALEKQW